LKKDPTELKNSYSDKKYQKIIQKMKADLKNEASVIEDKDALNILSKNL